MTNRTPSKTNRVVRFGRACLDQCEKILRRVARARATIVREFSAKMDKHERLLHLALNEAEALSWETGVPHLVFPTLAREKAQQALEWHRRQQFLQSRATPVALAA